ncbi:demethoxyubiquinone hydroxylase family protein [Phenylobacterium kunshanense]|uniref:Demethoxyubiquinone hydroxylase family protein n=1 Tax=Phenylobacterium kunshanense TaxID=1445034 RepID=A0A328BB42_9CAUL|nr:demethoxyubiquinone hydroxylase family protein [Phenylobacterium kunshanense]RAK64257.1 demethoxyubiquinone hydroxylase family protein [Phenylobacterium kunshanense]
MPAVDRTLADILRVNHAGECGAIRIYTGQRYLARWRSPDLLPFLDQSLRDERGHKDEFAALMKQRGITPCGAIALWGVGGWLPGLATAGLGRSAILICTEAVERTVHAHLQAQLAWLADRDAEVSRAIATIQVEELAHLEGARERRRSRGGRVLDAFIAKATELLIWISTYGASSRMARRIGR